MNKQLSECDEPLQATWERVHRVQTTGATVVQTTTDYNHIQKPKLHLWLIWFSGYKIYKNTLALCAKVLCVCTYLHNYSKLLSYLDVAGLLHKPSGVLCSSVSFGELDSEKLESPLEVCLQQVLFRRLGDEEEWEERGEQQGIINETHKRLNESFILTKTKNTW